MDNFTPNPPMTVRGLSHTGNLLTAAPACALKDRAKSGNLAGHGVFADRTFNNFWRGSDRELAIIDSV